MKFFAMVFLMLALAICQLFIGGARAVYSLPVFGLIAVAGVIAAAAQWKSLPALPNIRVGTALLFSGYLLARAWVSPVEYLARADLFLTCGCLIAYLLALLVCNDVKSRMWIVGLLCVLAVAHVAIGAIQFKEANQYMPFPWIRRTDDWWRASGFYISPNHFAGMLEVVAMLALSVAVWSSRNWVWRALSAYIFASCVLGVAISGSRGGYLSLAFGFVCWVALSLWAYRGVNPQRWLVAMITSVAGLALIGGAAVTLMFQSTTLKNRFLSINDPENMRFLLWNSAIEQHRLDPIWGTGSGTFLYYGRTFRDVSVQNDPIMVHNDYLHLLAEYGWVGVAVFAIFFLSHALPGLLMLKKESQKLAGLGETKGDALALHIGALSGIATYVTHSAVDFNLHIPANALLMAFLFGMIARINPPKVAESVWRKLVPGVASVSAVGAAAVILWFAAPLVPAEWNAEWSRQMLRDRHLPEALAYANKGISYDRGNPELYYYAGEATREMARLDASRSNKLGAEALRFFEEGHKVFPFDTRLMLKLAQTYDQMRRFDEAEEWLERATEVDPNSMFVHAYYGMHYHAQGFLLEAETEYELAVAYDGFKVNTIARAGLAEVRKSLEPVRNEIKQQQPPPTPDAAPPEPPN